MVVLERKKDFRNLFQNFCYRYLPIQLEKNENIQQYKRKHISSSYFVVSINSLMKFRKMVLVSQYMYVQPFFYFVQFT